MTRLEKWLVVIAVLVTFGAAASPAAAHEPISVVVNDRPLSLDVSPMLVEGRTLVPLRAIFDALGAHVEWLSHSRTVLGVGRECIIVLGVDQAFAEIYSCEGAMCVSHQVPLDVPARIEQGRTMVPLRFISEALGAAVNYDPGLRRVTVSGVSPAPDPLPTFYHELSEQLRLAGVTRPGTIPPELKAYTFGTGPIGIAVTSARTMSAIEVGGIIADPPAGHDWLVIRVSVVNAGNQTHRVQADEFTVLTAGWTIGTHSHQQSFPDGFSAANLAPGATSGGVLLFVVPRAQAYTLRHAGTDGSLSLPLHPTP